MVSQQSFYIAMAIAAVVGLYVLWGVLNTLKSIFYILDEIKSVVVTRVTRANAKEQNNWSSFAG